MSQKPTSHRENELSAVVKGTQFPMPRDAMVTWAKQNGVASDVVESLAESDVSVFRSAADVIEAAKDPAQRR